VVSSDSGLDAFYSTQSNACMFLERMGGLSFDDSIRVLTRNKMPPAAMLAVEKDAFENTDASTAAGELRRPARKRAQSFSALDIADDAAMASDMVTDDSNFLSASRSRSYSLPAVPEPVDSTYASDNRSPEWAPSAYSHAQASSGSMRPVQDEAHDSLSVSPLGREQKDSEADLVGAYPKSFPLHSQPGQTMAEVFPRAFQISYNHLTPVPASRHVDQDPAKARFYICYPSSAQVELECLQKFLRSYTFHTNICTSMDERGGDAFRNIYKGDYIGVIVVSLNSLHLI
jgi:hypothetical protein